MNNRYSNDSQRSQRNQRSRPMRGGGRSRSGSNYNDMDYSRDLERDNDNFDTGFDYNRSDVSFSRRDMGDDMGNSGRFSDYSRDMNSESMSDYGGGSYDYASQRGYGQGNYSPSSRNQDRYGQQGYSQARQRSGAYGTEGYSEADYGQGNAGYQGDTYGQGSSSLGRSSYGYGSSTMHSQGDYYNRPDRNSNTQDREEFSGHRAGQSSYGQNYGQTGYRQSNFGGGYLRNESENEFNRETRGFQGRGPKGYKRSDERIREEVCEALSADPRIDASEIEVQVSEGIVTLSGTVDERRAKRAAEDVAEGCTGVSDVKNDIRISASTNATGWGGGSTTEKNEKSEKSSGKSSTQGRGSLQ